MVSPQGAVHIHSILQSSNFLLGQGCAVATDPPALAVKLKALPWEKVCRKLEYRTDSKNTGLPGLLDTWVP